MTLSPYALTLCQRFILSGFDDPKVHSVFKKFPTRPGSLRLNSINPTLDDRQLDEYLKHVEEELRPKMLAALKNVTIPYTSKGVNDLLKLVKQSDILATVTRDENDISRLGSLLVEKARAMTIAISEDAEKEFRRHPSSENHAKWMATIKMIDVIGADHPSSFAPAYTPLYRKPYSVISGDTLSKIALRFYGHANLWDIIWQQSGMNFHPDLIMPGQKLTLP